jgi:hypothetical protein
MKRIIFFWIAALILCAPLKAFPGAFGIAPEFELHMMGSSQLQWSVIDGTNKQTYALYGKSKYMLSPGLSVFWIHDKNVFFGLSGFYRRAEGEFQTPDNDAGLSVQFSEQVLLVRFGYIEFYRSRIWNLAPSSDEFWPTFPFGHFRFGVFRSDISRSPDFTDYDPAWAGFLGLEIGALYLASEQLHFTLSGCVDYTFTVTPYTAAAAGGRNKILNNILIFGLTGQFGWISDNPR